jgi:hypothetical protein
MADLLRPALHDRTAAARQAVAAIGKAAEQRPGATRFFHRAHTPGPRGDRIMAEQQQDDTQINPVEAENAREGRAIGSFGEPDERLVREGGINQGTDSAEYAALTPEQQAEYRRRQALGDMVDDNAASHQGGMGAQSGQADYGSAGNLAGGIADRTS